MACKAKSTSKKCAVKANGGKAKAPVLNYGDIKFATKFMDGSKHLGVFPEQEPHWRLIAQKARKGAKLLNLFGYTGAATFILSKLS